MEAMPRYLGQTVPAGLMGLLIAAMLAADMSTDSSYMLTWGSVIYNDIMAPFRRTQWSERNGILVNRCIVAPDWRVSVVLRIVVQRSRAACGTISRLQARFIWRA